MYRPESAFVVGYVVYVYVLVEYVAVVVVYRLDFDVFYFVVYFSVPVVNIVASLNLINAISAVNVQGVLSIANVVYVANVVIGLLLYFLHKTNLAVIQFIH